MHMHHRNCHLFVVVLAYEAWITMPLQIYLYLHFREVLNIQELFLLVPSGGGEAFFSVSAKLILSQLISARSSNVCPTTGDGNWEYSAQET